MNGIEADHMTTNKFYGVKAINLQNLASTWTDFAPMTVNTGVQVFDGGHMY